MTPHVDSGHMCDSVVKQFKALPHCSILPYDNAGYDIGAYQWAAQNTHADLMLCLTASTYFNGRSGWLKRVVDSYLKYGDQLYGTMGHCGDPRDAINRHIRSTAFWITPGLILKYPIRVKEFNQRYEFEHRKNCLTEWIIAQGKMAIVVTWDGEYEWGHWNDFPNGYFRGDQSNVMIGDHVTERVGIYLKEKANRG